MIQKTVRGNSGQRKENANGTRRNRSRRGVKVAQICPRTIRLSRMLREARDIVQWTGTFEAQVCSNHIGFQRCLLQNDILSQDAMLAKFCQLNHTFHVPVYKDGPDWFR